jgi:hypothetical protein
LFITRFRQNSRLPLLDKIFPKTADNKFKGLRLAKWLLALFVAKSFFAGGIHMFAPDGGAQSIASVVLDQFSADGANTVITMFGLWGMEQVVIGMIGLVVLVRYNSLIPLMALVYVIEYMGRFLAELYTPGLTTEHAPPGAVTDNILVPLTVLMFLLSILNPNKGRNA